MKKTLLIIGCSLIAVAGILYYTYTGLKSGTSTKKEAATVSVEQKKNNKIIEIEEEDSVSVEKEFPMTMQEYQIRDAIHGMSHQKIEAEKKWGFIPLTTERVNRLLEVVKANQSTYKHSQLYTEILTRWTNKDFSRVDADHNAIWDLQNGTVGKATGILSHEEEMEFIQQYYDVEG